MKVGEVDLARLVNMLGHFDLHVRGGFDITKWSMVGMTVQNPNGHRNVIVRPLNSNILMKTQMIFIFTL